MTFHETIAVAVFHFDESLGKHEAEHGEGGKASPATSWTFGLGNGNEFDPIHPTLLLLLETNFQPS